MVSAHCSVQATRRACSIVVGGVAHGPDDRVGGHDDVVEAHLGEPADEVES